MKRSPAQVLGISAYATRDEARTAYRALARRWHPDRFMPGPEREWANERMTEINVAYAEFIKGVRNAHAADTEELSRVQGMIDDGNLSTARQLLMTLPTRCADGMLAIAAVNKHASQARTLSLSLAELEAKEYRVITVNGESTESYNDIGVEQVTLCEGNWLPLAGGMLEVDLGAHSVNVIQIR